MMDCISVENMRLSDAETIEKYVPSLVLMHRAAYGVYLAHHWQGKTAILCGSGNNGGDGYALSCILAEKGFDCAVFTLGSKKSPDSAHYAEKAAALNVPISPFGPGCLEGFDTVVDCLLGTGFQGAVRQDYRSAIAAINESPAFKISVDINSGMNGDTGEAETAAASDLTVTIGFVKHGLVTENAGRYMKRLVCADIGIRLHRREKLLCFPEEAGEGNDCMAAPAWLARDVIKSY